MERITYELRKAFVEFNEEDTEAAAVTAPEMVTIESVDHHRFDNECRADHPFFFLIRDNRTGAMLFMGRVVNPAGEK